MDIKEEMLVLVNQLFESSLVNQYAYHNIDHSIYVMNASVRIGQGVGLITDWDQRMLMTAGLWHDTGFVLAYEGHEEKSCELVAQYLPGFGFSSEEIILIQGMIRATRIPQAPVTLYEQVLADADLCYLGTSEAESLASKLFLELHSLAPGFDHLQWNERQISFLSGHRYWTDFAVEQFAAGKNLYLSKLKEKESL